MEVETVSEIFHRLQTQNPNPKTELNYKTPFELLVGVMLSAQATDVSVNKATGPLFQKANTPQALLALGETQLKTAIKTIGLFNMKAKHIIQTCQLLIQHHKGEVPDNRKDLEALPGVGRKTANVVLNSLFDEPIVAVDTHVFRVSRRIGLATGKTPLSVEKQLMKVIPKQYRVGANQWLVLHGRYICKARKPQCSTCLIHELCAYYKATVT